MVHLRAFNRFYDTQLAIYHVRFMFVGVKLYFNIHVIESLPRRFLRLYLNL